MVRSATRPAVTTALMAVASAILVLPYAIYLLIFEFPDGTGWLFIAATIALHIWYFATLGYAYNTGELTIVYPIARGLGLAIIPVLGVTVIGETMSLIAMAGAVSIITGIALITISDVEPAAIRRGLLSALNLVLFRGSETIIRPRIKPRGYSRSQPA